MTILEKADELKEADELETPAEESAEESLDESDDEAREKASEKDATSKLRSLPWSRVVAYAVLPGIALLLVLAAGYFKWVDASADADAQARSEAVRAASADAVALLSYKPDSVDKDLAAARERLTGEFKDAYTELTRQVVVPGAKERHIASTAKVSAAAVVSASPTHAVALLYVNQTVTIGDGNPTDTSPVIRVTLDKVNGQWLVSRFDPV